MRDKLLPTALTAAMLIVATIGCAPVALKAQSPSTPKRDAEPSRLDLIKRAQIWTPTDIAAMDLRRGPDDVQGFGVNELVTCKYAEHAREGGTPKFYCAVGAAREEGDEDNVVKVKYGRENGEVYGEVLATRLLWALGFGADRVFPVKVLCRGCSSDPWNAVPAPKSQWTFDPAALEIPFPAEKIKTKDGSGWAWPELDRVDASAGGATQAQIDALKLLAVFIQHTDSKPQQQRLVCLTESAGPGTDCERPFMLLNDLGVTFGEANWLNRNAPGSVNFEKWSATPVWKDATQCVGNIKKSFSGTLEYPEISEAGRAFLADLLNKLSDRQLQDLFDVARVDLRSRRPGSSEPGASVDEWVAAFKQKRNEIATRRCAA